VQICSWTKKSLKNEGECYKNKFYGVDTHACMEFSPSVMWCNQNCSFCWRPMEFMKNTIIEKENVDNPKTIVENLLIERKKLLTGFKGNSKVNRNKFEKSYNEVPSHFAISLSGEPTLYPKLNEMIVYLKSLPTTKTIFIVSNGQVPQYFENLIFHPEFAPTQLYVSIDAPNEDLYLKINRPLVKGGWKRLKESLKYYSKIDTRRVLRMTQIKGMNDEDEHLEGYRELFEIGKPDFIEVKAYMHIGLSQKRHSKDQMPEHFEVKEFAEKLVGADSNYEIVEEMIESRIVLLKRKDSKYGVKI
jgi:tRNA wybutosine-synthesizing protein 1